MICRRKCTVRNSTFMIIDIKNYFYGNKKYILSFQEEIFKLLTGVLNVRFNKKETNVTIGANCTEQSILLWISNLHMLLFFLFLSL